MSDDELKWWHWIPFYFEWPKASLKEWLLVTCAFSALVLGLYAAFSWLYGS